ncbi:MAG TPA: MarR family transcriptional regulator, partial [Actinomycetota bacterium]
MTKATHAGPSIPGTEGWASGRHIVRATRRLHHRLDGRIDRSLDGSGISGAQFELLDLIGHDRNAHAAALARNLGVSRQSASRLVARLVLAGLVDLLTIDAGVRVAAITDEGRRRLTRAHEATAGLVQEVEALDLDDRAWFVDVVERLDRSLRDRDDP